MKNGSLGVAGQRSWVDLPDDLSDTFQFGTSHDDNPEAAFQLTP